MIKHYCDGCGTELTRPGDLTRAKGFVMEKSRLDDKFKFPLNSLKVRVNQAVGTVWNTGDIRVSCVQRIVAEGAFTRGDL